LGVLAPWPPSGADYADEVRLGMYYVTYDIKADDLSGPFTPHGLNIDVKSVTTPYFAYVRQLAPNWQIELAAGIPPKTTTVGKGPDKVGSVPFNGQEVATVKWFAPNLLLEYVFFDPSAKVRPFIGAGVNYTYFYDRKATPAGEAANGGPTSIKMSSSFGPAGTLGATFRLSDRVTLTASYSRAIIKSNYESDTAGVIRKTKISFNPSSYVLSVGYLF
jgi:outer membrane protein